LPIDRDRRRAKRRYTRRQAAEAARAARRRRWQRILVAVIAVVALAAGIYGITRMSGRVDGATAAHLGVASHGTSGLITYGDIRRSPDGGGQTWSAASRKDSTSSPTSRKVAAPTPRPDPSASRAAR
jgi:hypothetical protein